MCLPSRRFYALPRTMPTGVALDPHFSVFTCDQQQNFRGYSQITEQRDFFFVMV
jgi:hypothetical protein